MAGESTTITKTEAPPADAPELADLTMPPGMTLDDFERTVAEPEAEVETEERKSEEVKQPESPTSVASPAPTVPTTPPAAEPPKGDLKKAVKEERGKRKAAEQKVRNLWEEIKREKAQGLERLTGRPAPWAIKVDAPKAAEIAKQAEENEVAGKGIRPALEATLAEAGRLAQDAAQKALGAVPNYIMRLQEQELREELADRGVNYDEVMEQSGIFGAVRQDAHGNFADPVVAKMIYGSANPAKRAFKIASDKLAMERKPEKPEHDDDDVETPPMPAAPAAIIPTAPPTPDALAEAKRAGAREVVETVAANTKRPQGVRMVRDAGQPVRVGKDLGLWNQLDAWMSRAEASPAERERFLTFMDHNPDLNAFLMAGPPKT